MRMLLGLAVGVLGIWLPARASAADANAEVRVMSYNIRYGTARDGDNHWDKRKDFLADTIKAFDPDLLGTQETLGFQRDFLAEKLPTHGVLGAGRDDGKEKGEMMALYWRKDRFEKLDAGHFWLSETPDKPGSKSWDSALPRMVTWVKLRDKKAPDAKPILFMNTHFDHIGRQARRESMTLIRDRLTKHASECSLILTGDFNTAEGSEAHRILFARLGDADSPVVDTFRVTHPNKSKREGTLSSFRAAQTGTYRIDWIAASRDWKIKSADIDRTSRNARTASDHWAVTAILQR